MLYSRGKLKAVFEYELESGFFGLRTPALNNLGKVAFVAEPSPDDQVLVYGADPVADKVIGTGDVLWGKTVSAIGFSRGGLNDFGQLAFVAYFTDGSASVVRATKQ